MRRIRAQRATVRSSVAVLSVALTAGFLGGATGAQAADAGPLASAVPAHSALDKAALADKVSNPLRQARGHVTAFVELAHPAGVDTYNSERAGGAGAAATQGAVRQTRSAIGGLVDSVFGKLRALDDTSHLLYRTSNAIAGFAVTGDAADIRRLAGRDDVRTIRTITPKKRANSDAVQLTKTLNAWQQTGKYGDGVKIGIIDNGIDYTHADFGGPGTVAAYNSVDRTKTAPPELFPSAKVAGGTDLAGDDYDAATPGKDTPHPDSNPLPCADHGTHVAGSAAGFGETADGKTFTGDYSKLTSADLAKMKIGPGTAPKATLYAFKVFGCAGSTSLSAQALDTSLDPNGDGNYADKMSVVNLSLGSDFGAPDDPDSEFVHKLAQNGVLSVIAAGNAGDVYDAAGSPGDATDALTVASVKDRGILLDGLKVNAPAGVAGTSEGQQSIAYTKTTPVTGDVVKLGQTTNTDGCDPLNAADAAAVKGKIAWLVWNDDDTKRRCGSAQRVNNITKAGATGSVFTSTLDQFVAGISGNAQIPAFQLTGTQTKKLQPAVDAGTLNVTIDPALRGTVNTSHPEIEDTPSDFTSRGIRGPVVKPDIAAPGDSIVSALAGSGNGRESISGTSMATPHTAGISALLRQVNPSWTPEEIKAGLMNTAGANVYSGDNHTGRVEGPQRVGAGRADALAALNNKVLAMNADDPGAVSVSFGTVEAPAALSRTKTIKLVNKGTTAASFNATYTGITKLPGVSYLLSQRAITVPAGGTASVKLTLRIGDIGALRKLIDPTMAKTQAGLARQFLADASGRVQFVPSSGSKATLRVPVYSAPKPVAAITTPDSLTVPSGQQTATLGFTGRGLNQGTGDAAYRSLATVLQLGATSPQLPACSTTVTAKCTINNTAKGGDLRFVGAMSTAPGNKTPADALAGFGIGTWGDWYNIGSNTIPAIDIDTNNDGKFDFETVVSKVTNANGEGQDVLVATTYDLANPAAPPVDIEPVNGQLGDVDTNTFDTNVLVAPVLLSALGIDASKASAPLTYQVSTAGYYVAPASTDGLIDTTGRISYDPLQPGLYAAGSNGIPSLAYVSAPGTRLLVHRNAAAAAAQNATSVLVLNYHNAKGNRAKAIAVRGADAARAAGQAPGGR